MRPRPRVRPRVRVRVRVRVKARKGGSAGIRYLTKPGSGPRVGEIAYKAQARRQACRGSNRLGPTPTAIIFFLASTITTIPREKISKIYRKLSNDSNFTVFHTLYICVVHNTPLSGVSY